jgi:hypothetical protein
MMFPVSCSAATDAEALVVLPLTDSSSLSLTQTNGHKKVTELYVHVLLYDKNYVSIHAAEMKELMKYTVYIITGVSMENKQSPKITAKHTISASP